MNNYLTNPTDTTATMTSKEIAVLVQSRHADVKRTIERLIARGVIRGAPMAFSEEINNLGFPVQQGVYVFTAENKNDTYTVVAQLSPEFTARIVERWQQLEAEKAAGAFNVPQTMSEALRLAADEFDARVFLQQKSERQEATIQEHLEMATVDEWRALNHVYLSQSEKTKLGKRATKLAAESGKEKRVQVRQIKTRSGEIKESSVGVYPRSILDLAAEDMGIGTNHGYSEAVKAGTAGNAMAVA